MIRIELNEKVKEELTDEEYNLQELGVPVHKNYLYQRIFPLVSEISPVEIEDNEDECIIQFSGGYKTTVRYNYDELCIRLNDMENNEMSDM